MNFYRHCSHFNQLLNNQNKEKIQFFYDLAQRTMYEK